MAMKREKGTILEERAEEYETIIKEKQVSSNRIEATRQASDAWMQCDE